MKVLLSFNEAYAPHAAAVITGLVCNSSQKISVVVLYYTLSSETIQKFYDYYSPLLNSIEFIKVNINSDIEKHLKEIKSHFYLNGNIETWLRLFASSYIQDDYVVWLDCDIVITGDICKILDEIDNRYLVSACKEYDPKYKLKDLSNIDKEEALKMHYLLIYDSHYYRTYEYYDIPHDASYFCAGIMYMNLRLWREVNLESQIIEKIFQYDYLFALDQDILNSVIKGRFCVITPKWNTAINLRKTISNYDSELLEEAEKSPCIVHLGGSAKPWNENYGGSYRKLYWNYRLNTPWPARPHWKRRLKNKFYIINLIAKFLYVLKKLLKPNKDHYLVSTSFLDEKGEYILNAWQSGHINE